MPKLNTNNAEVADYLCKMCKEWIEKWNIDGIRFDVAIEVYINAGEQQVPIDLQEQEIIFAHGYMNQRLLNGGALIVRRNVQ